MTERESPPEAGEARAVQPVGLSREIVEEYAGYLASIPEADDLGYERILAQIARAATPAELDRPWEAGDLEFYQDVLLRIESVRRLPSDFSGGLGWFLAIDAVVLNTGEKVVITNGAVGVVGQLAKAHALGAISGLKVIPHVAKKPTRQGYYPQHLEIVP